MRRDFIQHRGGQLMITTAKFLDGWATIVEAPGSEYENGMAHTWTDEEKAMQGHNDLICNMLNCPERHPLHEHIDALVKQQRAEAN